MSSVNVKKKISIYSLKTKKEILNYYKDWTTNNQYNKDMIDWKYEAPSNSVKLLDNYSHDKNIKILDAGCGTGLVGELLYKTGYKNIHGADFSSDMLNLVPNNLYSSLELLDLNKKLKFEDESFDAVICVGTFTFGHVKANALSEFLRILKKNGLICFTINEGIFKEYKFDIKINDLTDKNDWEIIKFSKTSYIIKKEVESWICLARKK